MGEKMPTIELDLIDLKRMLEVPDEELEELLFLNKVEVEEIGMTDAKVEITPDRPDMFSVEGIVRQLKSWLLKTKGLPEYYVAKPSIELKKSHLTVRPCIACAYVSNLDFTDEAIKSFMQLEEQIDKTIGKNREKSSIGVHDISQVKPPFTYKEVSTNTKFVPLGYTKEMTIKEILKDHPKGKEYGHLASGEKVPIIVDKEGTIISFPPITNAKITQVKPGTRELFIDITGTDENSVNNSLNILVTALADRGGRIEAVRIGKNITPNLQPKVMKFDLDYARQVLGLNEDNNKMKLLLERMNYGFDIGNKKLFIPAYRSDILHPIDVVEDIAIAYGYNNFVTEFPMLPFIGSRHPLEEFSDNVKLLIVGLGFQEVLNFTLISKDRQFKKMNQTARGFVEIKNPVSSEYDICRTSLLPSLIGNLSANKHRRYPQKIFEVGDAVVLDSQSETKTRNSKKLCVVDAHSNANLAEIISIINSITSNLGIKTRVKNHDNPSFIKGRSGVVLLGNSNKEIGHFGEINPKVLENHDLNTPVAALELDLDLIFEKFKK